MTLFDNKDLNNQIYQKYITFEIDINNNKYDIHRSTCLFNDCFNIIVIIENEVFVFLILVKEKCHIRLKIFSETSLDISSHLKLCILNTSMIECSKIHIYVDEWNYYMHEIKDFSDNVSIFVLQQYLKY